MNKRLSLIILAGLLAILVGCSSSDDTVYGSPSSNNWDEMNWDSGKWQ